MAEGQRPRNYLSCCCSWIFRLIYALSTSTTLPPLHFHLYLLPLSPSLLSLTPPFLLPPYVYLTMPSYLCLPTIIYLPNFFYLPTNANLPSSTFLYQNSYLPMSTYQHIPIYVNLPSSTYLLLPIPKFQYIIADPGAGIGLVHTCNDYFTHHLPL